MANKNTEKKIEKLKARISDYDLKIQMLIDQKQRDVKVLERLEAEVFIDCCKSKNITLSEAIESLEFYQELKQSGTSKKMPQADYSNTDRIKEDTQNG